MNFSLGGSEGRNIAYPWRPPKFAEPLTRLDLDVMRDQRNARFDMATFRSHIGQAERDKAANTAFEATHVYMGNGKWLRKAQEED